MIEKILKLNLDTSFLIHCDNQPDAIVRALKDSTINKMIRPVYKGKMNGRDYLEHTIDYVRKQQVYVLETSRNIINEQAGYVFKKDLAGNFENKPDPKCANHGIDAIRYAIYHGTNQAGKFRVIGTINAYQNVMWR